MLCEIQSRNRLFAIELFHEFDEPPRWIFRRFVRTTDQRAEQIAVRAYLRDPEATDWKATPLSQS